MSPLRALLAVSMVALLTGCETVSGWFSMDDEEDPREPAELVSIDESVRVRRLWSARIGDGQGEGLLRLKPALAAGEIYAASADGEVQALGAADGGRRWRSRLDRPLSGGVGVYGDALFLGTADGEVLCLDRDSGALRWSASVSGEVLAPPQGNGRVVVAQTYDGKLFGLDAGDGARLWSYDSNLPVLTIRGTSSPIVNGNIAYAAFANGRVLAFEASTGAVGWEARVAIAQGRSEIERLVDIDGSMALAAGQLYAVSYQGRVAAIDVATGRKLWQRDASSYTGVSLGFGNVYVAQEDGTVNAYLANGQGERWTQDALAWRGLSRPVPVSSYLAVTDFEGYLHLLSLVDGSFVARERVDGDGVRADMIADGSRLFVYGNSGKLVAYRVEARD